jgi:hypothetical protein
VQSLLQQVHHLGGRRRGGVDQQNQILGVEVAGGVEGLRLGFGGRQVRRAVGDCTKLALELGA